MKLIRDKLNKYINKNNYMGTCHYGTNMYIEILEDYLLRSNLIE
jgi:hypothetical protein